MNNPDDIKNTDPTATPTDQGEDSEERRDAAEKVWRDKSGQPRRESDDSVEPAQKRAPEADVDDIDEKR